MVAPADLSTQFALDVQAINGLRITANKTGHAGLEAAARQFEALFLNMMLKSMRDATPKDNLMESEQSHLYLSMLDQQLSQNMAARGVGLAEMMVRQLSHAVPPDAVEKAQAEADYVMRRHGIVVEAPVPPVRQFAMPNKPDDSFPTMLAGRPDRPLQSVQSEQPGQPGGSIGSGEPAKAFEASEAQSRAAAPSHVIEFQSRLMAHAHEVSQATGIPARFMLGQAALESGWGKRELRAADGTPSHNLFGIKAGGNWKGPVVEAVTTEYIDGVAHKTVEKFRSYPSYADAFRDYANLLTSNPRYAEVFKQAVQGLDAEGFAYALQRAGYATDPDYGNKLSRIIKTTPWS